MQRLSGQFTPQIPLGGLGAASAIGGQKADVVAFEDLSLGTVQWSPDSSGVVTGFPNPPTLYATNSEQISNPPKGITVSGWSIRYNGATEGGSKAFVRWGDVWGGLLVDPSVPPGGSPPILPDDLSTFAKLWTASDTPWPVASLTPNTPLVNSPSGLTYMLPAPIDVKSGQQLAMIITLARSLGSSVRRIIWQASWTILYDFTGTPFAP